MDVTGDQHRPPFGRRPGAVLRCLAAPGAGGGRRQGVRRIGGNHRHTQRCARSSSRWAPPQGARPAPCSCEPARGATGGRGGENYSDEAADESARGATTRLMRLDAARGTTQTNPRSGTRRPPRTCTNPAGTRRTGARRARIMRCELSSHNVSSARTMRAQLDKIHLSSIRASSPRTMRAEVTSPNRLPQGGRTGPRTRPGRGPDGTGAGKGPDEAGEGSGGGHTEPPGRGGTGKGPGRDRKGVRKWPGEGSGSGQGRGPEGARGRARRGWCGRGRSDPPPPAPPCRSSASGPPSGERLTTPWRRRSTPRCGCRRGSRATGPGSSDRRRRT